MIELLNSVDFWKFTLPFFGATIAWFLNEWRKRIWEQYKRKEEKYQELVSCLNGFYEGKLDSQKISNFLNLLNQCWLYCPDEVIKKAYAFLESVHTASGAQPEEVKEKAMGDLVLTIRKDLLSRKLVTKTKLTNKDFRHLRANF